MAKAVKGEKIKGGGKKGGTRFPNYSLKQVLPNLKEFISKTHSKPITIQQLNAGVFNIGADSDSGKIRFSSMKQFALAEGEYQSIKSTQLATNIVVASEEDKLKHIRTAFLHVAPFKNVFETFQGSTVPKARISSYSVSPLKVHPDLADKFVESFLDSADVAKVSTVSGDDVTFVNMRDIEVKEEEVAENSDVLTQQADIGSTIDPEDDSIEGEIDDNSDEDATNDRSNNSQSKRSKNMSPSPSIGIQLDASLDPEKLAKHLKLLRQYGLI